MLYVTIQDLTVFFLKITSVANYKSTNVDLNLTMQISLFRQCRLLIMSTGFKTNFSMDANTMNHDQTDPIGAVCSVFLLFAI